VKCPLDHLLCPCASLFRGFADPENNQKELCEGVRFLYLHTQRNYNALIICGDKRKVDAQ